jgi:hypothetical protein
MVFYNFFTSIASPYIRSTQKANAKELYELFHNNIQQSQIRNKIHLDIITNLIDQEIRKINVVTDDPVEKNIITEKNKLLIKLDSEIRGTYFSKDAEFLAALRTVFGFPGPGVL